MICVHSVNVYPQRIAMKTGEWYYNARAEVCPSNASCPCVTWSSSDPSIAIVHPTNGYIHGGRPGTATVYATATDGSGRQGCCTVTVSQRIYVNSITLNTFQISIQRNNNYLLTAEVCPSNADNKAINWCSSNTEVATVRGGRVYAHKKGAAVITAAAADGSGTEAKCYVNVTENYLVTLITVEPACKTLAVGSSVLLQETVYPNHATNKQVTWSSSNENVAIVNPTSGLVTAQSEGTATIYATAQDGSGKRGCCKITVTPLIPVSSIMICPTNPEVELGESIQLNVIITPVDASNQSIVWHNSDPSVAEIGAYTGIVQTKKVGTTVITAISIDNNLSYSITLTVKKRSVLIQKEGNRKEVIFNLTNKVWKCIDCDFVFYDVNSATPDEKYKHEQAVESFQQNCFLYPGTGDSTMKEYTDEEIKLLYMIDPHGIAVYVERYAHNTVADGITDIALRIRAALQYKDRIFQLLFNRVPRYFSRNLYGQWYVTNDTSDIFKVLSESEMIFGPHTVFDEYFLMNLCGFLKDIADMFLGSIPSIIFSVAEGMLRITKYFFLVPVLGPSVIIEDLESDAIGTALDTFDLGWADTLFTIYNNLENLQEVVTSLPSYSKHTLKYCADDLDYDLYIKMQDGQTYGMQDICSEITF